MLDPRPQVDPARQASTSRPRLPAHVYWRRRLLVLAVLGVVIWAGIVAIGGLVGGDDEPTLAVTGQAEEPSDDASVVADDVSGDASDGGEGIAADDVASSAGDVAASLGDDAAALAPVGGDESAAAADTPEAESSIEAAESSDDDTAADTPPSTSNPASVHIVGDSDAGTFGPYLQTLLDNTLIVETSLDYKVSSGLARPDFFNWPEQLRTTIPEVDPDIVVVTFGGNDSQGLSKPQDDLEFLVGDPLDNEAEWSAEYERRVLEVIDILLDDGREVIWVGSPNDDNPDVTAKLRIQDQAVRAAIAQRPDVVFVDTWTRFSGRDGNWAEFVVDPRDGIGKDVRADDGYHLNTTGAEILAIDIAVEVRDLLREQGAAI